MVQVAATCHVATEDDWLGTQIKNWFNMETYGTRVIVSGRSRADKRAPEQLEKTTKLICGRYEVGLPWAEDNATIQNKYFSAHSQFCFFLERALEKNNFLKGRYQEIIKVDLQKGNDRQIEESEMDETKGERQLYVPHHPVINPHKPE